MVLEIVILLKNSECYLILDHVNFGFLVRIVIVKDVKLIDNTKKVNLIKLRDKNLKYFILVVKL
jgi:hypothetical protein